MEVKILLTMLGLSGILCGVLYAMHRHEAAENMELRAALAKTSSLLAETQAELQLRETVIARRDAKLAELERKAEQKDRRYAKLVRNNKAVRDWDSAALPDDVLGLLKAGRADTPAGPTCDADDGRGNP